MERKCAPHMDMLSRQAALLGTCLPSCAQLSQSGTSYQQVLSCAPQFLLSPPLCIYCSLLISFPLAYNIFGLSYSSPFLSSMYLLICILQSLTLTHIHMLTLSHRKAPRLALATGYILSKYICDNNNNSWYLRLLCIDILIFFSFFI